MFQREGYAATSWRALVEEAGTPWGSISHHFPGGKEELGIAALEAGGDAVAALIEHCFAEKTSPEEAISLWFSLSGKYLEASGYTTGCPVATVALEASPGLPGLREVAGTSFSRWESLISRRLRDAGATRVKANEAAEVVLALMEGSLLLARVQGRTRPMRSGSRQAQLAVADATGNS